MLNKIAGIEARFHEIERELTNASGNYQRVVELSKERAEIEDIVARGAEYRQALKSYREAKELVGADDTELAHLAYLELEELAPKIEKLESEIKSLLLPKDPRDKRNVIVEIRAGAGGDEAGIFAADLYRMYTRYAERHSWKTELLSSNPTGVGGFKEVT